MEKPIKVAVFIPKFKWDRMNLHEITPEKYGIELFDVPIDTDLSQFDAILHKFTYQMTDGHEADVWKIQKYAKEHPKLVVIEPIDHIQVFTDRLALQNFINSHPLPSFIEYINGIPLTSEINPSTLQYPLLIKSQAACGPPESHIIQSIYSPEQMPKLISPALAFPFIPHHGIVYKCYTLGKHIVYRPGKSLVLHTQESSTFDSQKPLPKEIAGNDLEQSESEKYSPSFEEVQEIANALEEMTGVSLIGFDVIRRESDGKLCLIDFNYFPCFRGVDDVSGKFAQFIREKVENS